MRTQLRLILTLYIVNSRFQFVQLQNGIDNKAITGQVRDEGKIHENFRNYFNSIVENNDKKSETYRDVLLKRVASEQEAFDTLKGKLQNANRQRNTYTKSRDAERNFVQKRETNGNDSSTVKPVVKRYDVGDMSPCNYLYIQIKNQMPQMNNRPENEERKEIKEDICTGIMKSEWMYYKRNLTVVDQRSPALHEEVRKNYPNISAYYSSEAGRDNRYTLQNIIAYDDESLDNEIHEMETHNFQEYVFSCLARHHPSGKLEQYFISQEYDLGKCKMRNLMAVFLRFVFTFEEQRRGVYPVAFTDDRADDYQLEPEE